MPHGDGSDIAALGLFASGGQLLMFPNVVKSTLWLPQRITAEISPLSDPLHAQLLSIIGALYIAIGLSLFTVRWNPINGKTAGLGLLIAAGNMVYRVYSANGDSFDGPGKAILEHAVVLAVGAIAIMFFANKTMYKEKWLVKPGEKPKST
mmetsp:Transcript_23445/g.61404  ORF Transcript_23445/g.61404 Transcript_23445/m.61404 type:complete len:150 (+) Transcript_23445:122-571(+)